MFSVLYSVQYSTVQCTVQFTQYILYVQYNLFDICFSLSVYEALFGPKSNTSDGKKPYMHSSLHSPKLDTVSALLKVKKFVAHISGIYISSL